MAPGHLTAPADLGRKGAARRPQVRDDIPAPRRDRRDVIPGDRIQLGRRKADHYSIRTDSVRGSRVYAKTAYASKSNRVAGIDNGDIIANSGRVYGAACRGENSGGHMANRSNACSELTRFWLQARHGCFTDESVPVAVPYASSDIDLLAIRPDGTQFALPFGERLGPRLIVETKDEHDWEPSGKEFATYLKADMLKMDARGFVPKEVKGVKFTMLRQQHYDKATALFGTDDFDRLFVVHALDASVRAESAPRLAEHRIYWLTIPELVDDLAIWYKTHPRPATLRFSFVGDLMHLLLGFCQLSLPERPNAPAK